MFKWLFFFSILLFIPGCTSNTIEIPSLEEDTVLITHMKEPKITIIDTVSEEITYEENIEFFIDSFARVDEESIALAGTAHDEVKILHTTSGEIDTLIQDIEAITALLYDEHKDILYLSDAKSNEVIVFSMQEKKIQKRIPVGLHPSVMQITEDILYVLHEHDYTIGLIDTTSYEVIETIPVLDNPTDFLILDNTDEIWVVGHGEYGNLNQYVYIYEKDTGTLLEKIKAGSMPITLFADHYTDDVFVLSHGSHELHIFNQTTKTRIDQQTTELNPYHLTADEKFIYITALDGDEMMMLNRNDFVVEQRYTLPAGPYGIILGGYHNE